MTILASRLSAPGFSALTQTSGPSRSENTSRLLAGRGVGQVGDFAQLGLTWVNVANTSSTLTLGDNSLKGVLTEPQNQGSVETVVVRISDDSPETPQSGALALLRPSGGQREATSGNHPLDTRRDSQ